MDVVMYAVKMVQGVLKLSQPTRPNREWVVIVPEPAEELLDFPVESFFLKILHKEVGKHKMAVEAGKPGCQYMVK